MYILFILSTVYTSVLKVFLQFTDEQFLIRYALYSYPVYSRSPVVRLHPSPRFCKYVFPAYLVMQSVEFSFPICFGSLIQGIMNVFKPFHILVRLWGMEFFMTLRCSCRQVEPLPFSGVVLSPGSEVL